MLHATPPLFTVMGERLSLNDFLGMMTIAIGLAAIDGLGFRVLRRTA